MDEQYRGFHAGKYAFSTPDPSTYQTQIEGAKGVDGTTKKDTGPKKDEKGDHKMTHTEYNPSVVPEGPNAGQDVRDKKYRPFGTSVGE